MVQKLDLILNPKVAAVPELFREEVLRLAGISEPFTGTINVLRRSVDARSRKGVKILFQVVLNDEKDLLRPPAFMNRDVSNAPSVVVVGAGPAGLFSALRLIELGVKPVVLERGCAVNERKRDIATLSRGLGLNVDSNYCFGEGGAGTFSDGKLYTRSKKKGDTSRVLELFHHFGAPKQVLYDAHPHIGSDKLPEIIKRIRQQIQECGGEICFRTQVNSLILDGSSIKGVRTRDGAEYRSAAVILATGHSARDVYWMLYRQGLTLESKSFAMGVRVEHPQELIDNIQYHGYPEMDYLPAATYSLAAQSDGRGVYSFCMCPGGYTICASSVLGELVVNGMSSSARHTPFANSGVVVEVRPQDVVVADAPVELQGMVYQQELERMAAVNGGGYQQAPAQRITDFVSGKISSSLPPCSYLPDVVSSPVHFWLPPFMSSALREGFQIFDRRMRGFLTDEALVLGVESRTSSPVRIPRDPKTYEHVQIKGLFPCGEGAGYAGGITSSAVDGMLIALAASTVVGRIRK